MDFVPILKVCPGTQNQESGNLPSVYQESILESKNDRLWSDEQTMTLDWPSGSPLSGLECLYPCAGRVKRQRRTTNHCNPTIAVPCALLYPGLCRTLSPEFWPVLCLGRARPFGCLNIPPFTLFFLLLLLFSFICRLCQLRHDTRDNIPRWGGEVCSTYLDGCCKFRIP